MATTKAQLLAEVANLQTLVSNLPDPPPPPPTNQVLNLTATASERGKIVISWTNPANLATGTQVTIARDGVEAGGGSLNWSGQIPAVPSTATFNNLADNTTYTLSVTLPGGSPVAVQAKTIADPTSTTPPPTTTPTGNGFSTTPDPGYQTIFAEDYNDAVPLGQFASSRYMQTHDAYDGFTSTDKMGMYSVPKVVSVSGGNLDYYLHVENGQAYSAAVIPGKYAGFGPYAIVEFRMRVPDVAKLGGFKQAVLTWANVPAPGTQDYWAMGENDIVECSYGDANVQGTWFLHGLGGADSQNIEAVGLGVNIADWHTYRNVTTPQGVFEYVDGKLIKAHNTPWSAVAHHLVLQCETWYSRPGSTIAGHVQFDWVKIQVPA